MNHLKLTASKISFASLILRCNGKFIHSTQSFLIFLIPWYFSKFSWAFFLVKRFITSAQNWSNAQTAKFHLNLKKDTCPIRKCCLSQQRFGQQWSVTYSVETEMSIVPSKKWRTAFPSFLMRHQHKGLFVVNFMKFSAEKLLSIKRLCQV